MRKDITTEEMIERYKKAHGDTYDYSLAEYTGSRNKVKIICPIHGLFEQTPKSHYKHGCRRCSQKSNGDKVKPMSYDTFLEKSNIIHNNKYDYSLVDYKKNSIKVKIICPTHGVFKQTPAIHLKGSSCPKCFSDKMTMKQEDFVERAKIVHNNKYDYSLVEYDTCFKNIKIKCPEHGVYIQVANDHLRGSECSKCYGNYKYNKFEFIEKVKFVHNNKYDYSLINDYVSTTNKISIICPTHGKFEQSATNHLSGQGCPICKESYGEKIISKILNFNNIYHEREKRFDDCKYKNNLPFDFYLPEYNTCIEFDGKQHFEHNSHFGGMKRLLETQIRDKIKNEYCLKNNIRLIRIRYDENIEDILNKELFNV